VCEEFEPNAHAERFSHEIVNLGLLDLIPRALRHRHSSDESSFDDLKIGAPGWSRHGRLADFLLTTTQVHNSLRATTYPSELHELQFEQVISPRF
jgi:hypothetical protein